MEVESTERIDDLPIFPLGTVLFPGAILPLHIFEDRYKQMMRFAVENGGRFGLSYRSDASIGRETPPEVGSVGCVAKINAVVPLEEGKVNVISTGVIRYRVLGLQQSLPFILARVEPFTDDLEPGADLNRIFDDISEICKRFLEAARALDEAGAIVSQDLPDDPEGFSLIISSALPIDNDSKQNLLEMTSTRLRLTRLRHYVINALAQYNERLKIQERAKGNGHGKINRR
ncbi:MAG TPA: LON peptidase substrate-binding domain-containing protein [Blastocatellia bacterium]|jgi:Lon protease-like protein|nr:LON peptidase substrate-binding domain-containing protein [Blastocatellia bacterium]